jgi:predicted PolB exonuclease-like 3'-5' exonuclease
MLDDINIDSVIFFDIETCAGAERFGYLTEPMQGAWEHKHNKLYADKYEDCWDSYEKQSALHPEFGKICCISLGVIAQEKRIEIKSFYGENEKELLISFSKGLNAICKNQRIVLCGHNVKMFDIPYIAKRMIINRIKIHSSLNMYGKKPWDLNHIIDTMDVWKMGNYRGNESIKVLCAVLGVPTPKDDIDGSQVSEAYYRGEIERIKSYCEKDVIATCRLFSAMRGEKWIEDVKD